MSEKVVVFATVVAKPGFVDQVLSVLQSLVEPSRMEEGCLNYDLHGDVENSNVFVFHETWLSPAHLDAHSKTPHYVEATSKFEDLVESVVVRRSTQL